MSLYYSKRAAEEMFDEALLSAVGAQQDEVGAAGGASVSPFAASVTAKRRLHRSNADIILKSAKTKKKRWIFPSDAAPGDLVDVKLRQVNLGVHCALDVTGGVFLLSGEVASGEISAPITVIAVGSPDNYSRYHGSIGIPESGWYPSSADGRAFLYEKIGLISTEKSRRELVEQDGSEQGAQWKSFRRIHDLLLEARYSEGSGFPQEFEQVRVQAIVEDRFDSRDEKGRTISSGLLLRLILVDS